MKVFVYATDLSDREWKKVTRLLPPATAAEEIISVNVRLRGVSQLTTVVIASAGAAMEFARGRITIPAAP